ncbi:MAG TPA: Uma2 family endonuclease [Tepidisphaeraceae bacterium]|nr:Uma2 family endonuclease [Tepidisphaeraceae bacterium]
MWEIAELFPGQGDWTESGYLRLDTNRLVEFDNGIIEVLPMPKKIHQIIMMLLHGILTAFFATRSVGGIVIVAGYKLRIPGGKYREPDLLYLTADQDAGSNEDFTNQADLVIEIVSPDDPDRDYVKKRLDYALARVPEYWIVDRDEGRILVLTLDNDAYVEHGRFIAGHIATSRRFAELSVTVDEVLNPKR